MKFLSSLSTFIFLSILIIATFHFDVQAKTVTLHYCLEKTAREHPLILKEQEKIAEAESYLQEARTSRFFPELKLRLFSGPVPDADGYFYDGIPGIGTGDDVTLSTWEKLQNLGPFFRINFEGVQPIYTFGGISSLIEAANAGVEAKRHQLNQEKSSLSENLIKLYLGFQLAQEVLEVQRDLRHELEKIKDKIEEWLASGSPHATHIDRLRLKVFTALLDKEILASEKGEKQARATFLELCQERDPETEIAIQPLSEEIISLPDVQEFIAQALNNRPEMKALQAAIIAKEAFVSREKSDYFPRIFLAGGIYYGVAPGRTPQENVFIDDDFNYFYGGIVLGLEQNLSFHLSRIRIRRARAEYRELIHGLSALESAIAIQVSKDYENVEESMKRISKIREGMKAARTWMFASMENYYLGVEKISEVIDAFGAYLAIKWQFFQAIYDYQKTLMELYLSAGKQPWIENE